MAEDPLKNLGAEDSDLRMGAGLHWDENVKNTLHLQ
jgi:hypothetical protein